MPLLANMSINLPDVLQRLEESVKLEVRVEIEKTADELRRLIEKRKETVRILCMTHGAVRLSAPDLHPFDMSMDAAQEQFQAMINKVFGNDQDVRGISVLDMEGRVVQNFERTGADSMLTAVESSDYPVIVCSDLKEHSDAVTTCLAPHVNETGSDAINKAEQEFIAFSGEIKDADDIPQGYLYIVVEITKLLPSFSENYFARGDGHYLFRNGMAAGHSATGHNLFSDFPELKKMAPDSLPLILKDNRTGRRVVWFMLLSDVPVEHNLFIGHQLNEAGMEQWQTTFRIRILISVLVILIALALFARYIAIYTDNIRNTLTSAFSRLLTDKIPFDLTWSWPIELKHLAGELNQISVHYVETEKAKAAAEKDLRKTACALSSSNQELEQFAYVVSHDLQEPLRTIAGYLRLLDKRYGDQLDHKANEFITYSVQAAQRMHNLIQSLLAYSRVTTRAKPLNPVDCGAVVDIVLSNLKAITTETSSVITRDELPVLMADHIQLGQLFQNLIGNAIKFRGENIPEIHISCRKDVQLGWVFSIRDNGIGIEAKYFERIFVVFQRLHGREKYAGTGIGLAICKKIVERHGGQIWVESSPGRGTVFSFNIPDHQIEGLKKYCEI